MNIFGGMKILWICFGVIAKLDYFGQMGIISKHLRVKVQNRNIFGGC